MRMVNLDSLKAAQNKGLRKLLPKKGRIAVGMGTCGIGNGAEEVFNSLAKKLKHKQSDFYLTRTGCFGYCAEEPLVNIYLPGKPLIILHKVTKNDTDYIISCLEKGEIPKRNVLCKIETWDHITDIIKYGTGFARLSNWDEIPFFKWQKKIVLRNCGLINPEDIEEYFAIGGYQALYKTLSCLSEDNVIAQIKKSRLRGRGGAGFPTGVKWELMKKEDSDNKYIICNADEGDPGAYMNRNEIESDPHSLLEGMLIGGYTLGAKEGIIYVRAEYPLAVKRLKLAIEAAKKFGLIGDNIFNSGFSSNISLVEGAGAFVCGEETALIASVEGQAGRPRSRPPFPAQKGLWDKPTNINNVETWYNIPVIIQRGADWFSQIGSPQSAGTKVFSLVGKIQNTGLVELPLGATLETIVFNIGNAAPGGKAIKAIQTGGPSGGCIPKDYFSTSIDYESLTSLGSIMGSGGIVVMDEDNCMVDVARYFIEFTTTESCGKCVPCREGLYQVLKFLKAISDGEAQEKDLDELIKLGDIIKDSALCGLGQTGPNPVLTTLRYFKQEYLEHIKEKKCTAGICEKLFVSPCENICPLRMNIPGFIQLFKEKRCDEAFSLIIQDNPLPATTGRVCHHPCEKRCRRAEIDEAIAKREIHRYIADEIYKKNKDKAIFKRLKEEKIKSTNKKIAIIGAGPAGLTAAFYLIRLGHEVVIYEQESHAGGMLRLTIPDYRLPKKVLEREINNIKSLGVKFIFKTKIGHDISLKKLEHIYDAIFLSIGAQEEISLGIPGEDLFGVLPRLHFLRHPQEYKKYCRDKKLIVIGGGNVALDTARTALRLGAKVTIVYRREKQDMLANREEIEEAEKEGIKFIFLSAPLQIIADEHAQVKAVEFMRMIPGDFDLSGRRRPVPTNETYTIACDKVMLAVGDRVDAGFIKKEVIKVKKNNTVEVDAFTLKTNNPKIYAGGDVISGPATVAEAMAAGKKWAKIIDTQFMNTDRFLQLSKKFIYQDTVSIEPQGHNRVFMKKRSLRLSRRSFNEVCPGLVKNQIEKEVVRCLRCDVKTS